MSSLLWPPVLSSQLAEDHVHCIPEKTEDSCTLGRVSTHLSPNQHSDPSLYSLGCVFIPSCLGCPRPSPLLVQHFCLHSFLSHQALLHPKGQGFPCFESLYLTLVPLVSARPVQSANSHRVSAVASAAAPPALKRLCCPAFPGTALLVSASPVHEPCPLSSSPAAFCRVLNFSLCQTETYLNWTPSSPASYLSPVWDCSAIHRY